MNRKAYLYLVATTYVLSAGFLTAYFLSAKNYRPLNGSYNNDWLEIYEIVLATLGLLVILASFDKKLAKDIPLIIAGWTIGLIIWLPPLIYMLVISLQLNS